MMSDVTPNRAEKIVQNLEKNPSIFSTPCYIYDVDLASDSYLKLKKNLDTLLFISLKANSCVELTMRIDHIVDGKEAASIKELNQVVGGGDQNFVNNPAADRKLIRAAAASKSTLILDNLQQIDILEPISVKTTVKPVMLRLNSCVLREFDESHPKVRGDQFGMDWNTCLAAVERLKELNIEIKGLHLFKGSYCFSRNGLASIPTFEKIISAFEEKAGPIQLVNLGGGFSENWRDENLDFEAYRALLAEHIPKHVQIAHESGRGVFGTAGFFLTRVLYTKTIQKSCIAVCDGGIAQNFLLGQTENPLRKYKTPLLWSKQPSTEVLEHDAMVAGSSCSKDDIIGKLPQGSPKPQAGDVLIFENCGAYNSSYSVVNFLMLPEAKKYII